ncbi:hypothetical protein CPC08DRAFT_649119 [Agrocybe pediades]|nr:hypothetical protein CPC08DRAFT_649119 [Agrocybe pediades]
MYTRCRRKMIKLNADPDKTNNVFRELTKEDVKASTAILKPNIPGSTKLKLSWIWHSVRKHLMMVDRVHWLRARAQADRWREERLLVTYEMQWTVRSFLHKCTNWRKACEPTAPVLGAPGVLAKASAPRDSPGARAYAERQANTWLALAVLSDRQFKIANKYYKSPIT